MTTVILVAHAPLASAFRGTGGHCFAEAAQAVHAIDVQPQESQDAVAERLLALVQALPAGEGARNVLILADTPGATPCNAAQRVAQACPHVHLVAGLNLPMLWRTLCYLGTTPFDELPAVAAHGGIEAIRRSLPEAAAGTGAVAADAPGPTS